VIDAYFAALLHIVAASPAVNSSRITLDQRSANVGLVRGEIYFLDGSVLHFPELPTAPHHKHLAEGAPPQSTTPPDLASVLREIELLLDANR
jgi:hypothetical protein